MRRRTARSMRRSSIAGARWSAARPVQEPYFAQPAWHLFGTVDSFLRRIERLQISFRRNLGTWVPSRSTAGVGRPRDRRDPDCRDPDGHSSPCCPLRHTDPAANTSSCLRSRCDRRCTSARPNCRNCSASRRGRMRAPCTSLSTGYRERRSRRACRFATCRRSHKFGARSVRWGRIACRPAGTYRRRLRSCK